MGLVQRTLTSEKTWRMARLAPAYHLGVQACPQRREFEPLLSQVPKLARNVVAAHFPGLRFAFGSLP